MNKFLEFLQKLIPFLDVYPSWVKIFIAIWIVFSAFILICLLFFREAKETKAVKSTPTQYKILNPAQSKVSLSKPQSLPPNQKTKIEFDKIEFDTLNEFDHDRHIWTAAKSTLYKFDLNVRIEKLVAETKVILTITRNGVILCADKFIIARGNSGKLRLQNTAKIDAYDYIEVFIEHNCKENISLINDSRLTYLLTEGN